MLERTIEGAFVGIAVDGDAVWLGTKAGVLSRIDGGNLTVKGPVLGIAAGHGRLCVWDDAKVRLLDDQGAQIGVWSAYGEAIESAAVTGENAVEICSLDTQGHPYDRCGYRRAVAVGQALDTRAYIATGWGKVPDPGVLGVEPQRDLNVPLVVLQSPTGRVERRNQYMPGDCAVWVPAAGPEVTLALSMRDPWGFASTGEALLAWSNRRLLLLDVSTGAERATWEGEAYIRAIVPHRGKIYVLSDTAVVVLLIAEP